MYVVWMTVFQLWVTVDRCKLLRMMLRMLLQLFSKLQATKQEIVDLQEANARERQELEQTQNELTRELKLKSVLFLLVYYYWYYHRDCC